MEINCVTLAAVGLLACAGCARAQPESVDSSEELRASIELLSLQTASDVQRVISMAAADERAILFIHVDWAPMESQRSLYADFAVAFQQSNPQNKVQFYYVDCTPVTDGYRPLKALAGWKEIEAAKGQSLLHGYGEVVWMKHGRVLHVERIENFQTTTDLIGKTLALLPASSDEYK